MLAVVVSRADEASEHVGERLLELDSWREELDDTRPDSAGGGIVHQTEGVELRTFDDLHLHLEDVASAFDDPSLLVFASRHSGDTGPLLTAHVTGNFGPAEYGGNDGELARAAPNALARVRESFERHRPNDFDAGIECTHHGPSSVGCPSLFVELGSGPDQWSDPAGARAVARSILDLRGVEPNGDRAIVGFGGGHYAPRFDRILGDTDWGVGHVASDWCLEAMGDPASAQDVIEDAFERSGTEFALIEGSRPDLAAVIRRLGFRTVSETWLGETTGVPLSLVETLENRLSSIDDGLRFGDPAEAYDGDVSFVELPAELLKEANGIDREGLHDVVNASAIAYETEEGATLVSGRIALAASTNPQALVHEISSVLEDKYDSVEVDDREVVARRDVFDPELARAAGVDEGPDFGRLADGEAVETDCGTVRPEDVRRSQEVRFPGRMSRFDPYRQR